MRVVCVQIVKGALLDAIPSGTGHVRMGRGYWARRRGGLPGSPLSYHNQHQLMGEGEVVGKIMK